MTIDDPSGRRDVIVLRRGALVVNDAPTSGHLAQSKLARLVAINQATSLSIDCDSGVIAYPPGRCYALPIATWVRKHLEAQVDSARAAALLQSYAGARLSLTERELDGAALDETDLRIIAAMDQPRRLDQIWPLARTSRFRLLAFVHFVERIGVLQLSGVTAPIRIPDTHMQAMQLLGVRSGVDQTTLRRAYHQAVRSVHPDLHASSPARAELEERLRQLNVAYQLLTA